MLTGYRGFSRRFVKSCPLLASDFDVEIELNLSTYGDGVRILRRLLRLYRDVKPGLLAPATGLAFMCRVRDDVAPVAAAAVRARRATAPGAQAGARRRPAHLTATPHIPIRQPLNPRRVVLHTTVGEGGTRR